MPFDYALRDGGYWHQNGVFIGGFVHDSDFTTGTGDWYDSSGDTLTTGATDPVTGYIDQVASDQYGRTYSADSFSRAILDVVSIGPPVVLKGFYRHSTVDGATATDGEAQFGWGLQDADNFYRLVTYYSDNGVNFQKDTTDGRTTIGSTTLDSAVDDDWIRFEIRWETDGTHEIQLRNITADGAWSTIGPVSDTTFGAGGLMFSGYDSEGDRQTDLDAVELIDSLS